MRGMPRIGWTQKNSVNPLPERLSFLVLVHSFPPDIVAGLLATDGPSNSRTRLLPPVLTVYCVLALALLPQHSYEQVMRFVMHGWAWIHRLPLPEQVPTKAAFAQARARLGAAPFDRLFHQVAAPLAPETELGAFHCDLRILAVDHLDVSIPLTPTNKSAFDPDGGQYLPKVRLTALGEIGSGAALLASVTSAIEPHRPVRFGPSVANSLLILDADQPIDGAWPSRQQWITAFSTRFHTLSEVTSFEDGSFLARLRASPHHNDVAVRVIRGSTDLITSLTDSDRTPTSTIRDIYENRWNLRCALELVTPTLPLDSLVLRSRTPEGVTQELLAYLCVLYATVKLRFRP